MKTLTTLFLFMFLGIGFTTLSAQNSQNQTGSYSEYYTWDTYSVGVFCNDEWIDVLNGSVTYHHVGHWQKGVWVWCKTVGFGDAVSDATGEVFSVMETNKGNNFTGDDISKVNLKGNQGSHYILSITYYGNGDVIVVKSVCTGSDK